MDCPNCNTKNIPQDARFCPNCGISLLHHYDECQINFTYNGIEFSFVKISHNMVQNPCNDHSWNQLADFYIMDKPVTYAQWWAIMGSENTPNHAPNPDNVDIYSFDDEEVIAYDYIYRFGEAMDDAEIDAEIAKLKISESLFRKRVSLLRQIYGQNNVFNPHPNDFVTRVTYDECMEFCSKLNEIELNFEHDTFSVPNYEELVFAYNSGHLEEIVQTEWTCNHAKIYRDFCDDYSSEEVIAYDRIARFGDSLSDDEIDYEIDVLKTNLKAFNKHVHLLREWYKDIHKNKVTYNMDNELMQIFTGEIGESRYCQSECTDERLGFRVSLGPVLIVSDWMLDNE